jgi:hypothetical protein
VQEAFPVEVQTVHVLPDNTGVVECPHCGVVKTVKVAEKHKNRRTPPVRGRCTCGFTFQVFFEVRKTYRKETNLWGYYTNLSTGEDQGRIQVIDLSIAGIGFTTAEAHGLAKGDEVKVKFRLDDKKRSVVEKDVVVNMVKDKRVGCRFKESDEYDNVLGFYFMP